jgi:hypothetical protein
MIKQVAATDYYRIRVDTEKNRIYFEVMGQVSDPTHVENLVRDMEAAIKLTADGFTCLSDLSHLKILVVRHAVEGVISTLSAADVRKVAAVWGPRILPKFEVRKAAKQAESTGYTRQRKDFENFEQAEAWLDE